MDEIVCIGCGIGLDCVCVNLYVNELLFVPIDRLVDGNYIFMIINLDFSYYRATAVVIVNYCRG